MLVKTRFLVFSWILAACTGGAALSLVVASAWWWLPGWRPDLVLMYSPWPALVMRAARIQERNYPTGGGLYLTEWASQSSQHCVELLPYMERGTAEDRRIVVRAFSGLSGMEKAAEVDVALLRLMLDPNPEIRRQAALAITDYHCIAALELYQPDQDPDVAAQVATTLERLHLRQQEHDDDAAAAGHKPR